jgi:hypothetical protein
MVNHGQSVAIGGVAIGGNRWQSVAIGGNRWQSVAIRGTQRYSGVLRGTQGDSEEKGVTWVRTLSALLELGSELWGHGGVDELARVPYIHVAHDGLARAHLPSESHHS